METIRQAVPDDALAISTVHVLSWRYAYRSLIDPDYLDHRLTEGRWLTALQALLASDRIEGEVLLEDDHIVGCCLYGRGRDEEYGNWGEIVPLYLLPEYMGRGCGSRLLRRACAALRDYGFDRVYLWSTQGNPFAEPFYRKKGFLPTGETVSYTLGGCSLKDERYILESLQPAQE